MSISPVIAASASSDAFTIVAGIAIVLIASWVAVQIAKLFGGK
jgi:hypothetical protein